MSEFDLIANIQAQTAALNAGRTDVILGIGDDCALLAPPPGLQLALSTDTLVAGVHFFPDVDPRDLGYKALAVNLSDLAAMGAKPLWSSLNLTLPNADAEFVEQFMLGFTELAQLHQLALIGGDTTRGPLSIGVTVIGSVSAALALRRSSAQVGDLIFVSGSLGAAAAAVQRRLQGEPELAELSARLHRPEARIALGQALLGLARCAIDISDGLLAELGHVCRASKVGAKVFCAQIPMHRALNTLDPGAALDLALSGGDDYELCFTAAPQHQSAILALGAKLATRVSVIGEITAHNAVELIDATGANYAPQNAGYQHFR